MSSRRVWSSRLIILLTLGPSAACTTTAASDPSGSGAYGSGGSGSTYEPPVCDQGCQDYLVSWALTDTLWFAWNQKLAGHPVGAQDVVATCPLGGSVHITGQDGVIDNGPTTVDLLFSFASCESSDTVYDLTFSGEVSMDGSFDSDVDFAALTFSAPALAAKGALRVLDDPEIDQSCAFNASQQGAGDSFELAGRICGRSFDEASLSGSNGGGGGSGSGGSSSSAGSTGAGNDCTCYCPNGMDCTDKPGPNPCGVDADGIPEPCGCPVDCR